ncbi:hypothetical protein DTO021D3_8167 [Paecilomyces variotii]|nr:hypothetical protein DTO032I3_4681 [Paecilomyces variotii]KAJ9244556.1 hypothetical protein DTO169E5_1774 [Paecilomyces variotii]KAJ9274996.1 hypothetical protein DTO021D3_8167 [Paecilomyces variotii]KAJ9338778.1 hypothetical protein DTO027B6_8649 [Paecilomyces variotii]KAJ9387091.1 hypothetical protein DTO032I4_3535 [Paecilomyces variotii]
MSSIFTPNIGAIPTIRTRKALLLLDLQNDFIRPTGALPVSNAADILDQIPSLVQSFRHTGDVVWVRSQYADSRPLLDPSTGAERVILTGPGKEPKRKKKLQGQEDQDSEKDPSHVDDEAFLTTSRCCLPQTSGAQFPAPVLSAIDPQDTVIVKTDYSAFQAPTLVESFRSRFVTEIYLVGSLSNVGVYATALDAARHGFTVTLIEDCLGYRSFTRHEEAMRRMADLLGADGVTVAELLEEHDWQETDKIARAGGTRSQRPTTPAGIETVMDDLLVKASPRAAPPENARPKSDKEEKERAEERQHIIEAAMKGTAMDGLGDIEIGSDNGDEDDPLNLEAYRQHVASHAAARLSRTMRDATAPAPEPGVKRTRAKMRRIKNRDTPQSPSATSAKPAPTSDSRPSSARTSRPKAPEGLHQPGDQIGEGDSRLLYNLELSPDAFAEVRKEVSWQKMYHLSGQVPRLVAVQGQVGSDGSMPIYRHPADESPPLQAFSPAVDHIRAVVEPILGHPLNHVLIQLYRDGQDRISEHSDKTLDIVRGSFICNVSLGAQRVLILRTKASGISSTASQTSGDDADIASRKSQRVPLPHGSLFILGPETNQRWLHGIRPDKRPESEKTAEERAFGGERISLTFRHIGTFIDPAAGTIWGQGAVSKSRDGAGRIIHGDPAETERLVHAFGNENHATEFDWDAVYGSGFDAINFVTVSPGKLVPSGDFVGDLRVRLALMENGLRYETVDPSNFEGLSNAPRPIYLDSDGPTTAGDTQILAYLAQRPSSRPGVDGLRGGNQLQHIEQLWANWKKYRMGGIKGEFTALNPWEEALKGRHYLGGQTIAIDDCSLWPVLRQMVQDKGPLSATAFPNLSNYYNRMEKRGCVRTVLDEMMGGTHP